LEGICAAGATDAKSRPRGPKELTAASLPVTAPPTKPIPIPLPPKAAAPAGLPEYDFLAAERL
jgi:hypothetical protein